MTDPPARSGLVVPVPEVEPVVGAHRAVLDAHARLGVPAHVTVLFPFVDPDDLDAAVLVRLAEVLAAVPAFDHRFTRTAWFDDAVLWLAPEDPRPFVALTRAVTAAFPGHPPFGGAHGDDVVPHLTVGHGRDPAELRAAESVVRPRLPVAGRADRVLLLAQPTAGAPFDTVATFPLAPPGPSSAS